MIFRNPGNLKIYIRPGQTDMRKSINGLALMASGSMQLDPYSESLFAFSGRSRKMIKLLYWDGNGFCLWQKRLEDSFFPWPNSDAVAEELSREEFMNLLSGIDFRRKHKILKFKYAG